MVYTERQFIVPSVYAELELLPATLESIAENNVSFLNETLIVLVVNNPPVKVADTKKVAEKMK